eukprot:3728373-Amphidinium_carterae.1
MNEKVHRANPHYYQPFPSHDGCFRNQVARSCFEMCISPRKHAVINDSQGVHQMHKHVFGSLVQHFALSLLHSFVWKDALRNCVLAPSMTVRVPVDGHVLMA